MINSPDETCAEALPQILLLDQTPETLQLLRHLLRNDGDVQFVTDGEEALAVATKRKPDLVLLDVSRSRAQGYDACRKLKRDRTTQDIPVIFVADREAELEEAKGLQLGAVDYIAKPISSPVLYTRIINHLGVARLNAELKRQATTDPLTGAFNRRHFRDLSGKELARMRRYRNVSSCLMLDIDHFKTVNDTYGHDAGDKALIATCRVAHETLRTEDVFGRLGGEEFAAMLPMTPLANALIVAERLRAAISAIRIPTANGELAFTASIGLTEIALDEQSLDDALRRADDGLYLAKNNGRNQVAIR